VSVETLLKKSGSSSPRRVFRAMLREIIARGPLPDYDLEEEPCDIIAVRPRRVVEAGARVPRLDPDTLDEGRRLVPGADIYVLEAAWRAVWTTSGQPSLRDPDKAFLGWVRKQSG
ncbi:MAG: replication initiator protein A, partial [Pseudomonadota bacterium]